MSVQETAIRKTVDFFTVSQGNCANFCNRGCYHNRSCLALRLLAAKRSRAIDLRSTLGCGAGKGDPLQRPPECEGG